MREIGLYNAKGSGLAGKLLDWQRDAVIIEMDSSPEWLLADKSPFYTNLGAQARRKKGFEILHKNAGVFRVTICTAQKLGGSEWLSTLKGNK